MHWSDWIMVLGSLLLGIGGVEVFRQLIVAVRNQPVAATREEFKRQMRGTVDARRAVYFAEAGFALMMIHFLVVEMFVPEKASFGGGVAPLVVLGVGVLGLIVFGTWMFAKVAGTCSTDKRMPLDEAVRERVPPVALAGFAASHVLLGVAVIWGAVAG